MAIVDGCPNQTPNPVGSGAVLGVVRLTIIFASTVTAKRIRKALKKLILLQLGMKEKDLLNAQLRDYPEPLSDLRPPAEMSEGALCPFRGFQ
jgi:hypothetical protein